MNRYLKERPAVSVIIPAYNTEREQFLKCIESISEQSMDNFEVIVINDGSDSTHAQMIHDVCAKDSRIKVKDKENGGVSSARNAGITEAAGEYIMFVDSDDWIDRGCLEDAYKTAEEYNADVVTFGYTKEYKDASVEVMVYQEDRLVYDSWKKEYDPFDMRIMGMCWMKLYRAAYVKKNHFNENLTNGEDVEFNFRIYDKVKTFVYMKEHYYHYRQNEQSAVRAFDKNTLMKYERTIYAMEQDVKNAVRKKGSLNRAYYSFIGISYLVINMNYIFTDNNDLSKSEQIHLLRKVSDMEPYRSAIKRAEKLNLPVTRKMSLIFAKYGLYYGIYIIMFIKKYMNKYRNGKEG